MNRSILLELHSLVSVYNLFLCMKVCGLRLDLKSLRNSTDNYIGADIAGRFGGVLVQCPGLPLFDLS